MSYRLTSTAHFLTFDVSDSAPVSSLLDVLRSAGARATFFVAGESARANPAIVRSIARAGHDVAARGVTPAAEWEPFRADARDTRSLLEDTTGAPVRGFRAPPGTLGTHASWGFEILAEEGFEYDSSCIAKEKPARYSAVVPDYPYCVVCAAGSLIELPISRVDAFGRALQARTRAGLPGVVSVRVDNQHGERERVPLLGLMSRLNAKRAPQDRVARLVRDFRFEAIGHRLSELSFGAPTTFAA